MKISIFKNIVFIIFITININLASAQLQLLKTYKLEANSASSSPLPSNSVSQIAVVESTIWIGTSQGLAKSIDAGMTWISFKDNSKFANKGIYAIAVSGKTIWASTGFSKKTKEGTFPTGSGYTFSTDNGETWDHVNQTLDNKDSSIISYGINDSIWILPIVVPEQNVTYDISLSPSAVWIASWASGLRQSTDNGMHWRRILLPLDQMNTIKPTDTLWTYAGYDTAKQHRIYPRFDPRGTPDIPNDNLKAFSVCAVDDDTIWCGTAGGVNKSTDGGNSWIKFTHKNQINGSPILANWVIAIRLQRFQGKNRIWTTNWLGTEKIDTGQQVGVSYTDDGGRTWINLLHGIKAYDFAFKDSIAYIATENGIYRTPDGGRSFQRISNTVSTTGGSLTISNAVSIIDSSTHQAITSSVFLCAGVIGDAVILGTGDGIARTIDNQDNPFGSNWKIYRTYDRVGNSRMTYAYPNPFAPNAELVRIHYGTKSTNFSSVERNVRIDIFDFGMNKIRTLINNAKRPSSIELDELWDGRDDEERIVANGVYFYRVSVDNDVPLYGKILVLQ